MKRLKSAFFLLAAALSSLAWSGAVEDLGNGMLRAWPAQADPEYHSFALQAPLAQGGTWKPSASYLLPKFSGGKNSAAAEIEVPSDWDLYGSGEVAGGLRRNGKEVETWNTDAFAYGAPQLYQSHPWVLALAPDGTATGYLADTTWRTLISLKKGIRFASQGPAFPVYVLRSATPQGVLEQLARLTGAMPLPPKWALGFQQCRYSYFPDKRALEVAAEFRKRRIPADVIWLDIDYMDQFKIFSFHPERFPDPKRLNDSLHALNFHSVWMIDPGVKLEKGYDVYDEGSRRNAWVKTAKGEDFVGKVWPGDCVFPDYTREDVRFWWSSLYSGFLAKGVDGVWNDMNEPAVFKSKTKTMPLDNRHEGYGGGPHARFHNVYGMLMAKATRDGIQAAKPEKRPFVLTRAGFLGSHRYAATWTGDNVANWDHLAMSVPMTLNLSLSGQPFSGPDIGGFVDNSTPKLFARWMGIGAMLPFARAHKMNNTKNHEPWEFGPEVEEICRLAINRRYRLMPYLYTVFEEASRSGLPVARPAFFADPTDPALRQEEASFLLGSDLLVQTQPFENKAIVHAQPKGDWKVLALDAGHAELPVLKLRPGAAIAVGPVVQHTGEAVKELTVYANLDGRGEATGWLYEDEGDGYGFRKGAYSRRKLKVSGGKISEEISGSLQGRAVKSLKLIKL